MSVRVDTTSLIAGACVVGIRGHGLLGTVIRGATSTGVHGPGYLYNDLAEADDDKEIRGLIVTPPASGTLVAYEDGSFDFTAPADGSYSFTYRLFVDGADAGLAFVGIGVGALPPDPPDSGGGDPDPEAPVSQGSRRLTLPEWLRGVT